MPVRAPKPKHKTNGQTITCVYECVCACACILNNFCSIHTCLLQVWHALPIKILLFHFVEMQLSSTLCVHTGLLNFCSHNVMASSYVKLLNGKKLYLGSLPNTRLISCAGEAGFIHSVGGGVPLGTWSMWGCWTWC